MDDEQEAETIYMSQQSASQFAHNQISGNAKVQLGHVYGSVTHNYNDGSDPSKWLNAPDVESDHSNAQRRHVAGTGKWLLESPEYLWWKEGELAHLWLFGMAGSGKTVLFSTVIDDLNEQIAHEQVSRSQNDNEKGDREQDSRLAAFYFSFADTGRQSYHSLLRSVVAQFGREGKGRGILRTFQNRASSTTASVKDLEDILDAIVKGFENVAYLCIDAIDECPEENDARELLLDKLQDLALRTSKLKLFMTSRELPVIKTAMRDIGAYALSVNIARANLDIATYLEDELCTDRKLRSLDHGTLIQTRLGARANGMFRWAFCQLQSLKKLRITTRKNVEQHLSDLPRTLDETYERMLTSICQLEESDQQAALTTLTWLIIQARPMTLEELIEVCVIDISDHGSVSVEDRSTAGNLIELLADLVTVRATSGEMDRGTTPEAAAGANRLHRGFQPYGDYGDERHGIEGKKLHLRLAHFSVQEYLTSGRLSQSVSKFTIRMPEGHRLAAQSCLLYLEHFESETTDQNREEMLREYPLIEYAGAQWFYHRRLCISDDLSREMRLLGSETSLRAWHFICRHYNKVAVNGIIGASGLYCATAIGLGNVVRQLCLDGVDVNTARGGAYRTALHAAAHRGRTDIARILLDYGADCRFRQGLEETPLQLAAFGRHTEIVRMLLEKGADPNAAVRSEPLLNLLVSLDFLDVLELVLNAGADPNTRDEFHGNQSWTALHIAARDDKLDAARLLLFARADPDLLVEYYGTTLHTAAAWGHPDVVRLLLSAGADPNAINEDHQTPLHVAAWNKSICSADIARQLLSAGASHNVVDKKLWTPLLSGSRRGNTDLARIFMDSGADVDLRSRGGRSPLHMATTSRKIDTLQLILDRTDNVDAQDDSGLSAIHIAADNDSADMLGLLLNQGADVDIRDALGQTALHLAVKNWNVDSIQVLLGWGADVDAQDKDGQSPRHCASDIGKRGWLQLLNKEANIDMQHDHGRTALHSAAEDGNTEALRLLIDAGANVDARDQYGRTALHLAVAHLDFDMDNLRLLLETRPNIDIQGKRGRTALHLAIDNYEFNVEALRLLLEQKPAINVRNKHGQTALHLAVENLTFNIEGLQLLLGDTINNTRAIDNKDEQSAVFLPSEKILAIDKMQLLLEHGADREIQDNNGWTVDKRARALDLYGRTETGRRR